VEASKFTDTTRDLQNDPPAQDHAVLTALPERIGRYRIQSVLGKGGFGVVYLAQDEQLNRPVAVKVPHAKLIDNPKDAEAYLAEARTVARCMMSAARKSALVTLFRSTSQGRPSPRS
jgi:hypothetical protein